MNAAARSSRWSVHGIRCRGHQTPISMGVGVHGILLAVALWLTSSRTPLRRLDCTACWIAIAALERSSRHGGSVSSCWLVGAYRGLRGQYFLVRSNAPPPGCEHQMDVPGDDGAHARRAPVFGGASGNYVRW